ncbi:MAG TPA: hypothetical protein VKY19_27490 [Ktedonosporobacter sp.]|nr:hypothetical protein [Ktedonosporobacter sp.]
MKRGATARPIDRRSPPHSQYHVTMKSRQSTQPTSQEFLAPVLGLFKSQRMAEQEMNS